MSDLARRRPSSLHLMWADFGAGKTHTLFYASFLAERERMLPIYVEWPKKATSFVDVYRGIASNFSKVFLSKLFWASCERGSVDEVLSWASREFADFAAVLECLYRGESSPLIYEWLRAEPGLGRRELRDINVRNPIRTSDDAIRALVILVGLVARCGDYQRLVLMLDEFQRIDQLPPRIRTDVNSGIHTLINACPDALSIILSFSFGRPDNIRFLLTEEVRSRTDLEQIRLPELTETEALEFLVDLLRYYRWGTPPNAFFPFTEEACRAVLSVIGKRTPRNIMKHFDVVLRRADRDVSVGAIQEVGAQYALDILKAVPLPEDSET